MLYFPLASSMPKTLSWLCFLVSSSRVHRQLLDLLLESWVFKSSLFQVVQIVLGILSVVLGGILYICHYLAMYTEGAPLWTGIVAMLAGAVAFLQKKRGGTCWVSLGPGKTQALPQGCARHTGWLKLNL